MAFDDNLFLKRFEKLQKDMQKPAKTFEELKVGDKLYFCTLVYDYSKVFGNKPKFGGINEIVVFKLEEYWRDKNGNPTHFLIEYNNENGSHRTCGYVYEDEMKKSIKETNNTLSKCLTIISLDKGKLVNRMVEFVKEQQHLIRENKENAFREEKEYCKEGVGLFNEIIEQIFEQNK